MIFLAHPAHSSGQCDLGYFFPQTPGMCPRISECCGSVISTISGPPCFSAASEAFQQSSPGPFDRLLHPNAKRVLTVLVQTGRLLLGSLQRGPDRPSGRCSPCWPQGMSCRHSYLPPRQSCSCTSVKKILKASRYRGKDSYKGIRCSF